MEIPVYAFAGFLESGKTRFIKETLSDPNFTQDERTLVILCEEGEEELDEDFLKQYNAVLEVLDSEEELNPPHLMALVTRYRPDRIMLEWNGMWTVADMGTHLPKSWNVYQIVTTINAKTFELYAANMGKQMLEHIANADLVILNRADEATKTQLRARNLRAMNPRATFYFENEDGTADDYRDKSQPLFDMDAPVIEVSNENYGLWYMDASEEPRKYEGKTIRITGMVYKDAALDPGTFVPGRFAMVCCANDMTFIGFLCHYDSADDLKNETWVTVTANVKVDYYPQFREIGPVLYATSVVPAEKPDPDIVYFNSN